MEYETGALCMMKNGWLIALCELKISRLLCLIQISRIWPDPSQGPWEPGALRAALSLGGQATAGGALH